MNQIIFHHKLSQLTRGQKLICLLCIASSSFTGLGYYFDTSAVYNFFTNSIFSWSALILSVSLLIIVQIIGIYSVSYLYLLAFLFLGNFIGFWWIKQTISLYGGFSFGFALFLTVVFALLMSLPGMISLFIWRMLRRQSLWVFAMIYMGIYILFHDFIYNFNWLEIGYYDHGILAQHIASITGVHGITLYYLVTATIIVRFIGSFYNDHFKIWTPYILLIIMWIIATLLLSTLKFNFVIPDGKPNKVAMLQGNIDAGKKINHNYSHLNQVKYQDLVNRAINEGAQLIVLPESAMGIYANNNWDLYKKWSKLPASIVLGSLYYDLDSEKSYNIAYMLNSAGNNINQTRGYQFYNKQNLVPFGEYLPFPSLLTRTNTFLQALHQNGFTAGNPIQNNLVDRKGNNYSLEICYDIIFGRNVAIKVAQGANSIISISDDIWFGKYLGPKQHLAIAQTRAMENQRQIIRAANSGITALIDKDGAIVAALPVDESDILIAQNQNYIGLTPFSIYGIFSFMLIYVLLWIGGLMVTIRKED